LDAARNRKKSSALGKRESRSETKRAGDPTEGRRLISGRSKDVRAAQEGGRHQAGRPESRRRQEAGDALDSAEQLRPVSQAGRKCRSRRREGGAIGEPVFAMGAACVPANRWLARLHRSVTKPSRRSGQFVETWTKQQSGPLFTLHDLLPGPPPHRD
jgi:hypothetical protein